MAAVSTPSRHPQQQGKSAPTPVFESPDEPPSTGAATATGCAEGTAARKAAVLQPLSWSPEELEVAREKEHREQLLGREYMPEFRSPRPVEYDRFQSVCEARANSPYALPPKRSLESRYLTSYKPAHVQEMHRHLLATRVPSGSWLLDRSLWHHPSNRSSKRRRIATKQSHGCGRGWRHSSPCSCADVLN